MFKSRSIAVVIILAAVAVASWPMYRELHASWSDRYGTLSHGYLVLVLVLWFGVRAWRSPPPLPPARPFWGSLPLLVALVLCSCIAEQLFIGGIRTALLPLIFLAAIATALGVPAARRLAGPAAFMYFGLPVWSILNGTLRSITTQVSQALVHLSGIPVYVEGNFVHLAAGTFEIAAGCAGMNYFVVALTLGAYACVLYVTQWPHRWKLMLAAATAGLLANWLRVTSLILIGHVTDMQHYLIRVDHLMYGWVLFLVAMLPVFWLARRFAATEVAHEIPVAAVSPDALSPSANAWAGVATVCAILLLPSWFWSRRETPQQPVGQSSFVFASGWQPHFPGVKIDSETREDGVEVFRAFYVLQSRAARISLPENSFTGERWRDVETRRIQVSTALGIVTLNEHRGFLNEREQLIWAWYVVANRVAASKVEYRLAELRGLLRNRRDAEVIAINSECLGNCNAARHRLQAAAAIELNETLMRNPSQNVKP